MRARILQVIAAVVAILAFASAEAAELRIGTRNAPSIDPHFMFVDSNVAYGYHIYGYLARSDAKSQLVPDLAESWAIVDDTTWEFKLRKGVKFHDGSDFTAEDIVFSFGRVPTVPNNPSPYSPLLEQIAEIQVVDPYTVRFKTNGPRPFMLVELSSIAIVSSKAAKDATTADFESGKAAIGTGPYVFEEYIPGDRLVLKRNDAYWGEKAVWDRVTFRIMTDDAARLAALLGGDIDVMDYVPPVDVPRLRSDPNVEVFVGPSNRVIFLSMDFYGDTSPYAVDKSGNPLPKNPFKDIRVRQALSKAIDRDLLATRVMDGLAIPASQMVVPAFLGAVDGLQVDAFDPAGAKALLAEAGYPDGFGITLDCTNDRYVNDAKVCQAVGQMLAQIGLDVKVEPMPKAIFFERARKPILDKTMKAEFSLFMWGWGAEGGEADVLWGGLRTPDLDKGLGSWNLGAYSNAEADVLIDKAVTTLDREARGELMRQAMAMVTKEYPTIPLYYQTVVVAARKGILYDVRIDERTIATSARPAN
jgi:peptide/nickel transport system substrate-binding protein